MKRFWLPKQTECEDKAQAGARHYCYIFSFLDLAFKLAATCHPQKHESPRTSRHENSKSYEQQQNECMRAFYTEPLNNSA